MEFGKSKLEFEIERSNQKEIILEAGFPDTYANDKFLMLLMNVIRSSMVSQTQEEMSNANGLFDCYLDLQPEELLQGVWDLLPEGENRVIIQLLIQTLLHDLVDRYAYGER